MFKFRDVMRAVGLREAIRLARVRDHPAWAKDKVHACPEMRAAFRVWLSSLTRVQRRRLFARWRTCWPPKWHRVRFGEDWLSDDDASDYLATLPENEPFRTWVRREYGVRY